MPKISVIIPCYNHGELIEETIESVLNQTMQDFEIIVVNDGSTDEKTNEILRNYSHDKVKIIFTENQKPSNARNKGIKEASGKYILPLDADDKIGEKYLELAAEVLDNNPDVGIVYCNAELFGDKNGFWKLREYKFPAILSGNCIFCSALYRKTDWERTGGYNPNMVNGAEDWDFWLSLLKLDLKVYKLNEALFFYRRYKGSSRANDLAKDQQKTYQAHCQLAKNHIDLYLKYPVELARLLDVDVTQMKKYKKLKRHFVLALIIFLSYFIFSMILIVNLKHYIN